MAGPPFGTGDDLTLGTRAHRALTAGSPGRRPTGRPAPPRGHQERHPARGPPPRPRPDHLGRSGIALEPAHTEREEIEARTHLAHAGLARLEELAELEEARLTDV
ncbi:hypothetical protein [Streptomyces sp. NPDC001843]|uniref:hypothetical protein n=1 Tax=Streptomyces sp. NPDC001843 TaxID=3364617 RepID=UPI003681DD80